MMSNALRLILTFGLLAEFAWLGVSGKVVVCQYNSWAPFRTPPGNFSPGLMDPTLCTHGVYEFATFDPQTDQVSNSSPHDLDSAAGTPGGYRQMVELKLRNPNFIPMLGLGGAAAGNTHFSAMAKDPARRAVFTKNVLEFLRAHNFEGLEFDWVSPAYTEDMENFGTLLGEMREEFDKEGLILSASLHAIPAANTALQNVSRACHFLVLMTYDYYGPWWLVTMHSAPLYGGYYSVNISVHEYLKNLVEPSKMVVSIPAYGRSYTLSDPEKHELGSVASNPGAPGPYTRNPGWLSFNEISEDIETWTTVRDQISEASYSYKGDQWVSYDDAITAKAKVKYVNGMNLAGVALWSVDEDNFFDNFTLLKTINQWLE